MIHDDTTPDGHHAGLPYHLELLSDPWRASAWSQALNQQIRPGDTVLDVGCGIGLHAVQAARAGASRVLAVESSEEARIARQVVRDNGVANVVEVVHADLARLPAEPVDVIMGSFVGRLLPDGVMRRAFAATAAWQHATTRFLPAEIRLLAAPVREVPTPALDRWAHPMLGVDLSAARAAARTVPWTVHLTPQALIGEPVELARYGPPHLPVSIEIDDLLLVGVDARLRGVAVWFEAHFGGDVVLDTGPGHLTFWGQSLWSCPLTDVSAGDEIGLSAELRSLAEDVEMNWTITTSSAHPPPAPEPISDPRIHLEAGRPRLAVTELLAEGIIADKDQLGMLVHALFQIGDPAAYALLAAYERHFGRHPVRGPTA